MTGGVRYTALFIDNTYGGHMFHHYYDLGSSELKDVADAVYEFTQREVKPCIAEHIANRTFPQEIFRAMGSAGYLGVTIPAAYEGAGMSMQQYVVILEGLAASSGSVALTAAVQQSLVGNHILFAGSDEQKQLYLPDLTSGVWIGAWCLTEPEAGSDAFGGMQTVMERTPDGWRLEGVKTFITNGSVANIYVVVARVTGEGRSAKNAFRACVISKQKREKRILTKHLGRKMGMHATDTAEVIFDRVPIKPDQVLEGDGRLTAYEVLNRGRVGIAAIACGLMRGALERAVRYAGIRRTFGKPIADYQGVSHPLADADSLLAASWHLAMEGARATDAGKLTPRLAARAKLFATESAITVCRKALETLGGNGYFDEHELSTAYCEAQLLTIGEGTSNMMRNIIAKDLFRAW